MSAAALILAACSWNAPGADPFSGSVPDAIDRYVDIPVQVRAKLRQRMQQRAYDDVATITRDHIAGQHAYTELRDMHFGAGTLCRTVSRAGWATTAVERGLVYCEAGHCIIVPTVCRNVSRVTRVLTLANKVFPAVSNEVDEAPYAVRPPTFISALWPEMPRPTGPGESFARVAANVTLSGFVESTRSADTDAPYFASSPTSTSALIAAPIPAAPEPGTMLMAALGVLFLTTTLRRRRV